MDEHEWSTVKIPKINTAKGQVELEDVCVKFCALCTKFMLILKSFHKLPKYLFFIHVTSF